MGHDMSNSVKDVMTQDHRYCDMILSELENTVLEENWAVAELKVRQVTKNILYHFEHEEETLFPWLEKMTGEDNGPTRVMRNEHSDIRQMLTELHSCISEKDILRYLGVSDPLGIYIQQHNLKEENILYPMIDSQDTRKHTSLVKSMIQHQNNRAA